MLHACMHAYYIHTCDGPVVLVTLAGGRVGEGACGDPVTTGGRLDSRRVEHKVCRRVAGTGCQRGAARALAVGVA